MMNMEISGLDRLYGCHQVGHLGRPSIQSRWCNRFQNLILRHTAVEGTDEMTPLVR